MNTRFPILVHYKDETHFTIVREPDALRMEIAFTVIEINIENVE